MKRKLLILGAGGHGLVVADAAIKMGVWSEVNFLDDNENLKLQIPNIAVIGNISELKKFKKKYQDVFIAIGDNCHRLKLLRELVADGISVPVIKHPSSIISSCSELASGCFLAANSVLGVGAKLGLGCIINSSATVDHENILADCVHISPGAHLGGGVKVGECSWVGIGASIREQVSIGANVMVGAGAAVIGDVEDNLQVVGVPARVRDL